MPKRRLEVDGCSCSCRDGLYVSATALRRPDGRPHRFRGLFTSDSIPSGGFVGFYSGAWFAAGEPHPRSAYAVSSDCGVVVPIGRPIDGELHPMAIMNEPVSGESANVAVRVLTRVADVAPRLPPGSCVEAVAFFAARDIERDEELKWFYGKSYGRSRYPKDDAGQPLVGTASVVKACECETPVEYLAARRALDGKPRAVAPDCVFRL